MFKEYPVTLVNKTLKQISYNKQPMPKKMILLILRVDNN